MTRSYPNELTRFTTPRFTLSDITPLTYRDGESYSSLLWRLFRHITEVLNPSIETSFRELITQLETEMEKAEHQYIDGVEEFQRIHDAFMVDVNASLMALNDSAVSDLVDDDSSLFHRMLQGVFANLDELKQVAVHARDFGAIPGSPDSTKGIQDAIDYAHEHGVSRVIVTGEHWIHAHIEGDQGAGIINYPEGPQYQSGVQLRSNVTLDLSKAVLRTIPNASQRYRMFRVEDTENVTIERGLLYGDRYDHMDDRGEWGFGVWVHNNRNFTIRGTRLEGFWGDGIYIAASRDRNGPYNDGVTIHQVESIRNRRQGMSIIGGRNIATSESKFNETSGTLPMSGVDIEPNSAETMCENISFRDCEFTGNEWYGLTAMGDSIRNITVDGCLVEGNRAASDENGQIRFVRGVGGVKLRGVKVVGDTPIGLELGTRDASVESCDIEGRVFLRTYGYGYDARFTVKNSILRDSFRMLGTDNMVATFEGNQIYTETSTNNQLYEVNTAVLQFINNVFESTDMTPLFSLTPNFSTIMVANNTFSDYGQYAIDVKPRTELLVQGNQFRSTTANGAAVNFGNGSNGATVVGNTHQGPDHLTTFGGVVHNIRVSDNRTPRVAQQSLGGSSSNVWLELTPFEWFHNGQVHTIG